MKVVAQFSHKKGREVMEMGHANELREIYEAIAATDAEKCRTKRSRESTMRDLILYSPAELNRAMKANLYPKGWAEVDKKGKFKEKRVRVSTHVPEIGEDHKGDRAMDGIKNKVGLEIQFGKYAFMGYDILTKMPIFKKKGLIEVGIEIVPMKALATGRRRAILPLVTDVKNGEPEALNDEEHNGAKAAMELEAVSEEVIEKASPDLLKRMSTGVSYYEQIKADLEMRGEADLDIPVLVLGVDAD